MRIDLLSLQLFVAACTHKNIARVAQAENMAPSAVSKRISMLEDTLGVSLFNRSNKGLELTPAAHDLLQHARTIMRDVDQLETRLVDHSKGLRGRIRLCASLSTVVAYLPGDLQRFLELYPAVSIELEEGLSRQVVRAVAENAADLGIFGGEALEPGLRVAPYRTDRLMVLMPQDHPLSAHEHVTFAEISEYDLVGPQKGSYLNALVLRAAADLSRPLRLRIRVNGFEPVRSMVEAKLGIGLVPEHHARVYVASGPLVAVPLGEEWALRRWNLCVRDGGELPAPVQLLLDHLRASAEVTGQV